MKPRAGLLIATSFFVYLSHGQKAPPSAVQIMSEATQQAAKENKNVLIIFHASWCGWCRKMDSSINDKACKNFFDDNYIIRHMVVDESTGKKNLENPGVYQFRSKYNGDNLGLPSWLIFDKDGYLLADSQMRPPGTKTTTQGENIGCPATEKEVLHFISILKKTSHLTKTEEEAIEQRFRQNEDK